MDHKKLYVVYKGVLQGNFDKAIEEIETQFLGEAKKEGDELIVSFNVDEEFDENNAYSYVSKLSHTIISNRISHTSVETSLKENNY